MAHGVVSYAFDLVIYALDSVICALDLVKNALDVVIYALDLVICALDPVNHALHLVALWGAGSFPPPSSNPWTDLAVYGLYDASSSKDVLFGMLMATHNFKGLKPPNPPKQEAWLGIFQPH